MKFYSFEDIKNAADCLRIAKHDLGLDVTDGRCAATWRGGTNKTSVAINRDGWHDFAEEESGSVIDLVAKVKYNGDEQQAQNYLGEILGLTPKMTLQKSPIIYGPTRYDRLIDQGYNEVCRYDYTDAGGKLVQQVVRMEHPDKANHPKEFLQCDADGCWSVKDCSKVLYNLPQVRDAEKVIVVEGEKDADTLIKHNHVATTNPQGAKKWTNEHSEQLRDKDVLIIPDNDEAGERHLEIVGAALHGIARSVGVLRLSKLPKGDVTDWFTKEGGTPDLFLRRVKSDYKPWAPTTGSLDLIDQTEAVETAKRANKSSFKNFILVPGEGKNGEKKWTKEPRHINDLIKECHCRFLGFPRKVGEELFDHDRDTGRITYFYKPNELFAWMAMKSKQQIDWTRGDAFVTKQEFFDGITLSAQRYEAISEVPDWPMRDDVYYSHEPLPAPSEGHAVFEGLVNFFSPANDDYRVLLKTLIAAPIYFIRGIPRPSWVIDSEDGAGTGKTTMAELIAQLYGAAPIQVQRHGLKRDMDDVVKRMVSSEGRRARVFLLDNVTGEFVSEELAGLITRTDITGKAPYGRGEEVRPNNLTYVITANSATMDNDLAVRSFYIFVKRMQISATWKSDALAYIDKNRSQIFADIVDILSRHKPFSAGGEIIQPTTRFPEFEVNILQPMAGNAEAYSSVVKTLADSRAESNLEEEQAKQVEETIRHELIELNVNPDEEAVFIRSSVVERWVQDAFNYRVANPVYLVRNLAKNGLLGNINPTVKRWPHNGKNRRSGVIWCPDSTLQIHREIVKRGEKVFVQICESQITGKLSDEQDF